MVSSLVFLLFCGNIALNLGNAQKLPRVKRQSLKVQINATSDSVCMRYIRPSPSTKLEGFVLGYGSSFFSNQYILLPSDGKSYITEVDAEPRYLIAVRPARVSNNKKSCSGKTKTPKPLQLIIGTLSPTSVFLSWGILVNPKHDWTTMKNCANDRFYTVRYREKDKNKKWVLQLCPTTETVVENLKPNTNYEFGVKDNIDNGIWSKIVNHKVAVSNKDKENEELQNNYKLPKLSPGDSKALVPITIIKQVIQNITHRTQPKIPEKSPLAGPILVHLLLPDFNRTQQKLPTPLTMDISESPKKILEWPAESKTPEVQKLSPLPQPAQTEFDWESNKPTVPSVSEEKEFSPAHTDSELESSNPSVIPMAVLPLDTLAPHKFPELPKSKTSILQMPMKTLDNASSEILPVPSQFQTPAPKTTQTKPAFSKAQPDLSSSRTSDKIDIPDSKQAVTYEPALDFLLLKTSKPLDGPRSTLAPSETSHIPFNWELAATPEGWHKKFAHNQSPLEQNTPKMPRITEQFKTTPALPETKFVPSTPKPSTRLKIPETKPAEKEHQWESPTPKTVKKSELPRSTLAPSKTKIPVSQMLPHLEEPKIVPAVTSRSVPAPVTTKISQTAGLPLATIASYEPIPSIYKEFASITTEVPDSKPASTEADNFPSKTASTPELPFTISAPEIKHPLSSPKTTESPHVLHSEPVPKPILFRTESPMTEIEKEDGPSKPKILLSPDVPQTKPDTDMVTFSTEQPRTTIATKGARRVPGRPKTSPIPGISTTKPGPKGSRRVPSKPKTSPSPHLLQTKPASTVEQFIPNKSKTTTRPRILETKPAVHQTTSQPFIIKPTVSSEQPKATMVPKETWVIPSTPKTSGKPHIPQTKPATIATFPGSIHLHIHVLNESKDIWVSSKPQSDLTTTESPHLKTAPHKEYPFTPRPRARPVVNKTTATPSRTRAPGLSGSKVSRGDKLTDQDSARLLSTSSSTSVDSIGPRKKPAPVATPPDSPRASLAPAKPTPMRRKPFPPHTVTSKPRTSENMLMPRAPSFPTASSIAKTTGPTTFAKTRSPKKPPTASSSPDYSNTTLFSSHPTTETDHAGNLRYTDAHVKYIKKDDAVPCSITDTLRHFPTEDEETREVPSSPPQNPPTNLTVVTVEGCPTFVILDWEKPKNDTVTEYKVVSTENGVPEGTPEGKNKFVTTTNQTHSTVENLKANTSYEFVVIASNPLGEGPSSDPKPFKTESADPRVNEPVSMGKDAIWTEIKFKSDAYSECKGKQYVKRTWYKKFVGVQLCNSLRYKIYLSDSLTGKFYNIGDQRGHGEDHCQFVDSYLDGRTGQQLQSHQLPTIDGFFRAVRQEPVKFGKIGAESHTNYVHWYECGTTVPGKW